MKLVLAIPSARLPRVPSFHLSDRVPKVRIPFLSLLIEPRSLNKWLFIWLSVFIWCSAGRAFSRSSSPD